MSEIGRKLILLNLAEELNNVSRACKLTGYSRDSFYRIRQRYEKGGLEALVSSSRRKPNVKNRVSADVERAVVQVAIEHPGFGQMRVASELARQGLQISPSGVRSVWQRHGLETIEKRRRAARERSIQCHALSR